MINANEFRIGNYCKDNLSGEWLLVDEIIKSENGNHVIGFFVVNREKYPLPNGWQAEPINLTPEILEKAGFLMLSKNEFVFNRYSVRKEKRLDNPVWEVYLLGNDATFHWFRNIKHLHQLQNLYFALTGTELNIQL